MYQCKYSYVFIPLFETGSSGIFQKYFVINDTLYLNMTGK